MSYWENQIFSYTIATDTFNNIIIFILFNLSKIPTAHIIRQ